MRASVAKKMKREARLQASEVFAKHCVVEKSWYTRKWVFTLFTWPVTNLLVVPLNWLGWNALGRWWIETCRKIYRAGNRVVVKRA